MVLASTAENDILSSQERRNKIKPTWFTDGTLPYFSNDNKPVLKFLLFSHSLKSNLLRFMPLLSTCGVWPMQKANNIRDALNFLTSLISRLGEWLSSIKTKTTQVGGQIVILGQRSTFESPSIIQPTPLRSTTIEACGGICHPWLTHEC